MSLFKLRPLLQACCLVVVLLLPVSASSEYFNCTQVTSAFGGSTCTLPTIRTGSTCGTHYSGPDYFDCVFYTNYYILALQNRTDGDTYYNYSNVSMSGAQCVSYAGSKPAVYHVSQYGGGDIMTVQFYIANTCFWRCSVVPPD